MAMLIRNRFELLTLRCWVKTNTVESSPSGTSTHVKQVVVSQLYRGEQALTPPAETDLALLGLWDPNPAAVPSPASLAGTEIASQLLAARTMAQDNLLWFHISRESLPLAILPWEKMVRDIADLVLVRIPNFFENSYRPSPDPDILVCASAPIGDGPYSLPFYLDGLLGIFDHAADKAGVRATVHIFVDREVQSQVARAIATRPPSDRLNILPPYSADKSQYSAELPPDASVRSPWLRWIGHGLKNQSIDIVHFISPGHFDGSGGSIVLAGQPHANAEHGNVIDADELIAFYDRLGCSVMGFSSPDMPQWVIGQRALAFELSWLRPGPILLSESRIDQQSALAEAYARLFGAPQASNLNELQPVHLCVHPESLQAFPQFQPTDVPVEALRPERKMAKIAENYVRQRQASLTETRDLTPIESWERSGATEALNFLSSLVSREGR